jgi:hypothetical protein
MQVAFCANCNKHTGHKRRIGVGTLLVVLITFGWSLLLIPFYSKRCVVCGLTTSEANRVARAASGPMPRNIAGTVSDTHSAPILKGIRWWIARAGSTGASRGN